eukprot:superscaffoldBa00005035_g19814
MQEWNSAFGAIWQLLVNPTTQGAPQTLSWKSKELKALCRDQPELKLENGLLVYTPNCQGPAHWVIPKDHRGVMLAHTHDYPVRGHRSYSATLKTLQQDACHREDQLQQDDNVETPASFSIQLENQVWT